MSAGDRMLFLPYGPKWRMLRKLAHNLLNVQRAESYVPYQDLENKAMLHEMLTLPERFLDSLRRYSTSLTTSMTYGWRTTSFDDPRMLQLFHTLERITAAPNQVKAVLLDIYPVLRRLPDFLYPAKKAARAAYSEDRALYMSHWLGVKQAIKDGTANPCLCTDLAKMQEKEGIDDNFAALIGGTVPLEAGAETTSNTLYAFIQVSDPLGSGCAPVYSHRPLF